MCGLAGLLDSSRALSAAVLRDLVAGMADTLQHRGPDDGGQWVDADVGIALGFRRLAIIDLSPEGHQPMTSVSGRYVLAFNGEIYNHRELRREFEAAGEAFRGRSDTEVMLAAFERWGPVEALGRFVGMFAFALWDARDRVLLLARDRLGEKPLYYGLAGGVLLFGSELKAIRAHPGFRPEVDRDALALYMRYGYVPAPYSIYRGIRKLPPATTLRITAVPGRATVLPEPAAYWSAATVVGAPAGRRDGHDAVDRLEGLLREAVGRQMMADVPLGAFLSGGIDSSTVVALMQAQGTRPTRTFTIGFREAGYDEAGHARAVADHLGTEHNELYVTPGEVREVVPELPSLYDEPFADPSSIPTALVSRLARQQVIVSLSGDGGDELLSGYDWYPRVAAFWGRLRNIPLPVRQALGVLAGSIASHPAGPLSRLAAPDRAGRLAQLGRAASPEEIHRLFVSRWGVEGPVVIGADEAPADSYGWHVPCSLDDPMARVSLADVQTYLPDDILVKIDRASMGVGLEVRAPLLDHRVVEFALSLPTSVKRRDGRGKWPLRQVLERYVPRELVDRPKQGFCVPIADWLRGGLRDWSEALLAEDRIRRDGFLDAASLRRSWEQHLSGRRDWSDRLWVALMFQSWAETSHTRSPRVGHPPNAQRRP